ncbi:MAG: imidazole glycerol phosphate synthase subunit HisH [Kiritimatiellae bacterium]|nr:imidazole glycerol phosphate synthase subunit HisH [Kiritimatiellia bacterium]
MTAIIDYKAGNLTSVKLAFAALGVETVVTSDPKVIAAADRVVFPGVGAAKSAMENLRTLGLVEAVKEAAATKPFLGICLGMQILFDHSEEDGGVDCLGIIPGHVRRFPAVSGFKVPEIGWNGVTGNGERGTGNGERNRPLWGFATHGEANTPSEASAEGTWTKEFYFVHSYYAEVVPETVGVTEYAGVKFTAMVKKGCLWACQFHPEKSGRIGLELLKEWLSC